MTTPVLLVLDDLDAADEELLDAVRQCRARCCEHLGTRARHVAHGVSRRTAPRAQAARHRRGSPSWPGRSPAMRPSRFRSTQCSRRPAVCRCVSTRSSPSGCGPRRVAVSAGSAARRRRPAGAARRPGRPHEQRRRPPAGSRPRRGGHRRRRAGLSVQGPGELRRRRRRPFFGREQLVAELVARLPGATLLGVVGPSGSGKSSIVRAGLSAALASGALPGSEEWTQVVIRPGEHPLDELARARRGRGREKLLLVVDQLEEVFTLCRDEGERMVFLDALTRPAPHETVVVAVRADFYGRFAALPASRPSSPRTTSSSAR